MLITWSPSAAASSPTSSLYFASVIALRVRTEARRIFLHNALYVFDLRKHVFTSGRVFVNAQMAALICSLVQDEVSGESKRRFTDSRVSCKRTFGNLTKKPAPLCNALSCLRPTELIDPSDSEELLTSSPCDATR